MDWHSVTSSTVSRVAYDATSMTLTVEFVHGGLYQYFDVPQAVFEAMLAAGSVGQFLSSQIKPNYRYSKM